MRSDNFNETVHLSILELKVILRCTNPILDQVEWSTSLQLQPSKFGLASDHKLEEQIEWSSAQPQLRILIWMRNL